MEPGCKSIIGTKKRTVHIPILWGVLGIKFVSVNNADRLTGMHCIPRDISQGKGFGSASGKYVHFITLVLVKFFIPICPVTVLVGKPNIPSYSQYNRPRRPPDE
ncbi:hypothetical protein IW261DRAFT_1529351 [Armillaria novae-zelandiae]|uniref:Uncharacterized protein n=1 Tax=Armillaria novae-zelandiae TaxID=153914 RepID=A0AA39N9P1_9AGAR|nr:hypothetical protein IW261DRAFT_1529351 [Armillaria novae-zelandiae]